VGGAVDGIYIGPASPCKVHNRGNDIHKRDHIIRKQTNKTEQTSFSGAVQSMKILCCATKI
jgi:hypothetical protein